MQITSLRAREQGQLLASFVALLVASVFGVWLSRRMYRSIAVPLERLEEAAVRFATDDLWHEIDVSGHGELARVGDAFNSMASTLLRSRRDLHEQAVHDPLTGLANRTLFIERIHGAIERARRRTTPVSVLFLDLDGFKTVNDTMGHAAGDETLIAVAAILQGKLRSEDTVARMGGDEFAVLLEEDLDGASRTAERLIAAFGEAWPEVAGGVASTASIGVATRVDDEGSDDLIRRADTAMYVAKVAGKGRWRASDPNEVSRASLSAQLEGAIARQEFRVFYQPLVDLQTGAIQAVEALVRWDHPDRGLLAPIAFLDDAERSGQIVPIDQWVLREACVQVRTWQLNLAGAADLSLHVNVSARQLHLPGFADGVLETLQAAELPPEHLVLEITETTLVADSDRVAEELHALRAAHVRLALDDFGTGFSSLSHLVRFPVDEIEDRSIVRLRGRNRRREVRVRSGARQPGHLARSVDRR